MQQYVGVDVSLEETSICIMDRDGRILQSGVVASEPEAIAAYVNRHAPAADRLVLETGQLSIWLTRELVAQGLLAVCVDARLAHKALSGRRNKSWRIWREPAGSLKSRSRAKTVMNAAPFLVPVTA